MRLEGIRTRPLLGGIATILGAGLLTALLATAPAEGAPAARSAGNCGEIHCPKPPPERPWKESQCYKNQGTPQFCGFPHNGTGEPLTITDSSLSHGFWISSKWDHVEQPVLINNYATSPTNGTSIPDEARAAFMAQANMFQTEIAGSLSLGNSRVNTFTQFKVNVFTGKQWGCHVTSPNPANGWVCVTSVWASGKETLAVASNTYCCTSEQLTASTTPTVTAAASPSAAPVVTLPVECTASRRGSCRGMLSFRAGKATGATRFAIPRGA
jgi:hypothetical protein